MRPLGIRLSNSNKSNENGPLSKNEIGKLGGLGLFAPLFEVKEETRSVKVVGKSEDSV